MKKSKDLIKSPQKLIIIFILLLFFLVGIKSVRSNGNNDYKFGILTEDGLKMVSISPDRQMVNMLKVNKEVPVWSPYGGEWIKAGEVKKKIATDQKMEKGLFFYNFGFEADRIIRADNEDKWRSSSVLINSLGLFNWMKFKFNEGLMLQKEETIKDEVNKNKLLLDEVMPRDFADNRVVNDELSLSVFNATMENGLAGFVTKRLEWAGYSVVNNDSTTEKINNCLFVFGPKTEASFGFGMLNQIFNCEKRQDDNLNENEVELYFGDNYVSMIKYSSYNKD